MWQKRGWLYAVACLACALVVLSPLAKLPDVRFSLVWPPQGFEQAEAGADVQTIVQGVSQRVGDQVEFERSMEQAAAEHEAIEAEAHARALDFSGKATGKALKRIPEDAQLVAFSLDKRRKIPDLSRKREAALESALQRIEDAEADCGMVFVDLKSGQGLAYNAGKALYTASACKAALVFYALQAKGADALSGSERDDAESAIRYSSNGAFDALSSPRIGEEYLSWQEGYGIEFDSSSPYYYFASAASMARIWADIFQYVQADSDDAEWFAEQLANTNRSFIRDGLKGQGATVYNKAGWIADEYNATTDGAYVDAGGRPYVMVILTSQPDSEAASSRCADLARELFNARKALE